MLKGGFKTFVDDCDAELAERKWFALRCNGRLYAGRTGGIRDGERRGKSILLHREVMARVYGRQLERNEWVDHINNESLNNTRANLRLATPAQNLANQGQSRKNTTGYKGVYFCKHSTKNPWKAQIMANGKQHYLGLFASKELAHAAYCKAAIELHGEFANFGKAPIEQPIIQLPLPLPVAA